MIIFGLRKKDTKKFYVTIEKYNHEIIKGIIWIRNNSQWNRGRFFEYLRDRYGYCIMLQIEIDGNYRDRF